MMLHDKMLPGQFLLDMKSGCKMDIYGAYGFHQNQQKQRLPTPPMDGEVLDLSRRCDSVETRKTPSPYNSTSSFGTVSPSTHCGSSPASVTSVPEPKTTVPDAATKLIFSQNASTPLPQGIASLYPLYYQNIKQEALSPPPAPLPPTMPLPISLFPQSSIDILQKTLTRTTEEVQKYSSPPPLTSMLYPNILNVATTGTINSSKATRPFNAYPRDPNMVAAHFVASDHSCKPRDNATEDYRTFRKRALGDLQDTNGGYRIVTNPKMRRNNTRSGQSSESEERGLESSDDSSNGNRAEQSSKSDTNSSTNNDCLDTSFSGGVKDEAYYERRRKNNAAAKKSRDRRRIKEDEIAIRAAYLERQNIELLCQIDSLKKQLDILTKV